MSLKSTLGSLAVVGGLIAGVIYFREPIFSFIKQGVTKLGETITEGFKFDLFGSNVVEDYKPIEFEGSIIDQVNKTIDGQTISQFSFNTLSNLFSQNRVQEGDNIVFAESGSISREKYQEYQNYFISKLDQGEQDLLLGDQSYGLFELQNGTILPLTKVAYDYYVTHGYTPKRVG